MPATWVACGEQSVTMLTRFPSSYTFATKEQASNLLKIPNFRSILQINFFIEQEHNIWTVTS
jgi:hypothetical protein